MLKINNIITNLLLAIKGQLNYKNRRCCIINFDIIHLVFITVGNIRPFTFELLTTLQMSKLTTVQKISLLSRTSQTKLTENHSLILYSYIHFTSFLVADFVND